MSNVELVIKIPEVVYEHILKAKSVSDMLGVDIVNTINAVANGVPLPKGHGNLIDTKEFIKAINDWADNIDNYGAYEELEIAESLVQNHAHTIIEADIEESEDAG